MSARARPPLPALAAGAACVVASMVVTSMVVTGCAPAAERPPTATSGELRGDLTVLAAASLTEPFTTLGEEFTATHPRVRVRFSFGGSAGLAQQVVQGAPADVLATASTQTLDVVADAGLVDGERVVFAANRLALVVPAGNPAGVTRLADLTEPDLTVALCAPQVPCGAAAQQIFAATGLEPAPDTLEQDVKAVLTKVELGEVDAALVYRTDALAAGDAVDTVEAPLPAVPATGYPIAVVAGAANPVAAQAFVRHVRSEQGQAVLAGAGFETP